ncbi:MAG TPA: DUF6600 domain-containing protein [Candidatus Acidoferrum sp.]|nr:DUF6600 domain-containing protein [Candidatus Acidoferrum sp.]
MRTRFSTSLAILGLALATSFSLFSLSVSAQTTNPGPGPSEQPNAPMEVGQQQPPNGPPGDVQSGPTDDPQAGDAQPSEAQPGGPTGEAPAKSDLGVARLSMMHGDVSTQRGDSGDWSAATLNQPLMGGDKISTGDNARAELQLDFANILRLGPNSKATIATFTHKDIQIQLGQGIAAYTVSKDSEAEPEIDTPNVSVHPAHHDGVFRVEVRPDGDTLVIVRKGEAQIATPQGSTEVHSGEMATIRGDTNSAQYKISQAPDRDDWDRWVADRDHLIENAQSWHHTNHRYTGAQDLDAYGQWRNVPDYGDVWVPNEPEGWVPYRDGNWVWEPSYGWTWVGYEPWGWAPYHYGRWFWYGSSWAWWPGPVGFGYNPFWAPAYVSFWGWGGGFGFGFGWGGWGGFGWLPIGPCDWFHPWWGGYRGRFGWVGRGWDHDGGRWGGFQPLHGGTRFSNLNNIRNEHIFRAMSTVGAGRFGAGRVTATAATRQQLNGAHMMAGNLPVVPTRASLSASGRAAAPSTIRNGGSERFFGSSHNNASRPASFQQQTAGLRQSMQQSHVGAVPAGGRTAAGGSFAARGAGTTGTMQKPSAGNISNREMGNSGRPGSQSAGAQNATRGGVGSANPSNSGIGRNAGPGNAGGYRPFTPPSSASRPSGSENMGPANRGSAMESQGGARASAPVARDGFRPFTPPSRSESSVASGLAAQRGSSGSYWNRTAPSSVGSRGYSSGNYGSAGNYGRGSYSRPQLDMHQPVVRGLSNGGYGGYGAGRGPSPSYGGYGGRPSAPPSYGGSHGGYSGGGHVSAPSGGGGHTGGGGGGHASGGGGGHSGGGGGHSSGGHH